MDYECFLFLCFITLGDSTVTKAFAAHDHTQSRQQNLCKQQLKWQKTPKYKALHNTTEPQAALIYNLCAIWLLGGFSFSIAGTGLLLRFFFTHACHLSWPWTCRRFIPSSLFPTVHWSACWFFFFYWSHWKSTEPSFPIILQQLSSLCWPQCCSMWLWIPLCRRSRLPWEMRGCDYL